MLFFFFFQAEDGIRDLTVTGVQTCALPIASSLLRRAWRPVVALRRRADARTRSRSAAGPPPRRRAVDNRAGARRAADPRASRERRRPVQEAADRRAPGR